MVVLLGLAYLYFHRPKHRSTRIGEGPQPDPLGSLPLHRILAISLYGALSCASIAFILFYFAGPHGGWDAWSIWNLRARFLFRGQEEWRAAFSAVLAWSRSRLSVTHPRGRGSELAICRHGNAARSWADFLGFYMGHHRAYHLLHLRSSGENPGISGGTLSGELPFSPCGMVRRNMPISRSPSISWLLSYCFRTKAGGLIIGASPCWREPPLIVAWTKNEGLLFLVAVTAAQFTAAAASRKWKVHTREMLFFSAGFLPVLMIIFYFKIALAPPNDLISSMAWKPTMVRILDFPRYTLIGGAFLHEMAGFSVLLLAVSLICLGITPDKQQRTEGGRWLAVLGTMLLGYFFIYVTTPLHLSWLLQTSLRRILVPLWPIAIFTFFLFARTPEEAAQTGPPIFPRLLKNFLTRVFRV